MARTDIMISQALLRENLEVLHDRKGRTWMSHVVGEAVIMYRCKPIEVKDAAWSFQSGQERTLQYQRLFNQLANVFH